jgi:hypothetical protein
LTSAPRAAPLSPWTRADALRAAVLIAVGGVISIIGWWQVSGRPTMTEQVGPLNLAVVGLALIGAGQASWFLRGRRAVAARRRQLLGTEPMVATDTVAVVETDNFAGSARLYHRTGCAMLTDRAWAPVPRAEHVDAGRIPCGVCAP